MNEYDKAYTEALIEKLGGDNSRYDYRTPDKKSDKLQLIIDVAKADARAGKSRDKSMSDIAREPGYIKFLSEVEKVIPRPKHTRYSSVADTGEIFWAEWTTGGVGGGSCWENSDPQRYTSDDVPEDIKELDTILEALCPNITYLQYKKFSTKVIKNNNWSINEYYGNSTDHACKYMLTYDLYTELVAAKIIGDEK